MRIITLTIAQEQRQTLLDELPGAADLSDFHHAIMDGDRAYALKLRDRLMLAIELRDSIGWSDDPNDAGCELTMDADRMVDWLYATRSELNEQLGELLVDQSRQKRGEQLAYYCHTDQQTSIAHSDDEIERTHARALMFADLARRAFEAKNAA